MLCVVCGGWRWRAAASVSEKRRDKEKREDASKIAQHMAPQRSGVVAFGSVVRIVITIK